MLEILNPQSIPDIDFNEKELQEIETITELMPYLKKALEYLHGVSKLLGIKGWYWPEKYDKFREALGCSLSRIIRELPEKERDLSLVESLRLDGFKVQSFLILEDEPTMHRVISTTPPCPYAIAYFDPNEVEIMKKVKESIAEINPKGVVLRTEHLIPLLVLGAEYLERHKEELDITGIPPDYIDYRFALEVFCTLYLLNPDHTPNEVEMEKVRKKGFTIIRSHREGKVEYAIYRNSFCIVIFQGS